MFFPKPGAGFDFAKLGSFVGDGIFSIPLASPVTRIDRAHLTVKVRDRQGNVTTQVVRFSVQGEPTINPTRSSAAVGRPIGSR